MNAFEQDSTAKTNGQLRRDVHLGPAVEIKAHAGNIKNMAVERTFNELTGSLEHDPAKTIKMMHDTGMLQHVIPELASLPARSFQLTLSILGQCQHEAAEFALAAALCQLDPNVVRKILNRLKGHQRANGAYGRNVALKADQDPNGFEHRGTLQLLEPA